MIYFICSNDYQVMKAVAYAASFNKILHIFNLSNKVYNVQENTTISYPDKNILTSFKLTFSKPLSKDTTEFLRILYDIDAELHVFEYVNELYEFGRDNVILHEQGDSSYILNEFYLPGEAIPDSIQQVITTSPVQDSRNVLWNMNDSIKIPHVKNKLKKVFNCPTTQEEDLSNTILFVHNEPDNKYTEEERILLYKEIIELLQELRKQGYIIHLKLHHKRRSNISFNALADKIIDNIPLELIDNLDKYKYVISVRNSGVENINNPNCVNGLTKEAITKCKKNWKYVYSRGIQKIKKKLNLHN